ncbi:hypothetical protein DFAR_2050005 [Desulfarculales bacterium]
MGLGRRFPWPRPKRCPRFGSTRLWGHGFVPAYFDETPKAIWLRRLRCPDCRTVIRLRPRGYWDRLQTSVKTIRQSLSNKLARSRCDPGLPRSRQRHWLKACSGRTTCLGLSIVSVAEAWPQPAGRRKVRAPPFPKPSTQECRCPGPAPRSTPG